MHPIEKLSKDSMYYVPSDEKTINVVLFCDINDQSKYDFVIFWLSYMNSYFIKDNDQYHINFDYETNLNMKKNIYDLTTTPTIRIIQKDVYIDFTEINVKEYTYDKIMIIIEKYIDEIIKKCNITE